MGLHWNEPPVEQNLASRIMVTIAKKERSKGGRRDLPPQFTRIRLADRFWFQCDPTLFLKYGGLFFRTEVSSQSRFKCRTRPVEMSSS